MNYIIFTHVWNCTLGKGGGGGSVRVDVPYIMLIYSNIHEMPTLLVANIVKKS